MPPLNVNTSTVEIRIHDGVFDSAVQPPDLKKYMPAEEWDNLVEAIEYTLFPAIRHNNMVHFITLMGGVLSIATFASSFITGLSGLVAFIVTGVLVVLSQLSLYVIRECYLEGEVELAVEEILFELSEKSKGGLTYAMKRKDKHSGQMVIVSPTNKDDSERTVFNRLQDLHHLIATDYILEVGLDAEKGGYQELTEKTKMPAEIQIRSESLVEKNPVPVIKTTPSNSQHAIGVSTHSRRTPAAHNRIINPTSSHIRVTTGNSNDKKAKNNVSFHNRTEPKIPESSHKRNGKVAPDSSHSRNDTSTIADSQRINPPSFHSRFEMDSQKVYPSSTHTRIETREDSSISPTSSGGMEYFSNLPGSPSRKSRLPASPSKRQRPPSPHESTVSDSSVNEIKRRLEKLEAAKKFLSKEEYEAKRVAILSEL